MSEFGFDDRSRQVLLTMIKLHISSGEPVGSRTLSKKLGLKLSPATIRNIMADLEEAGYVHQPHTSAGRIPTDKGYRFYVDWLIQGNARLARSDEEIINRTLLAGPEISQSHLLERASQLLSQVSHHVGFVLSPSLSEDILQHIEFVRLADRRVLVIMVSLTGVVHDRVIRVEDDFTQDELDRTTRYLVENFRNLSLRSVRDELVRRMSEEKVLYDRLLKNAILLCNQSLDDHPAPAGVYVDGTVNIFTNGPDFPDIDRMKALFRMFEEKGRLVKMLNQCLSNVPSNGIAVQIGAENASPSLRDCTVITSPYSYSDRIMGGIGIVGPTRMEYSRVIGIVSYVARLFNQVLNNDPALQSVQSDALQPPRNLNAPSSLS